MSRNRLTIAIQKSGRLHQDSLDLLRRCGLKLTIKTNALFCHGENLPIDVLLVRDDDIPVLVHDRVCDLGIIGENILLEQMASKSNTQKPIEISKKLGFSRCRLCIAFPQDRHFTSPASLRGLRIATSYPNLLKQYLTQHQVEADTMPISGSVEIAPRLGMADAICDLVSTGATLEENNLKMVAEVMTSQAVLIRASGVWIEEKQQSYELLLRRIDGVLRAQESKYIMFHAPKSALNDIKKMLPGFETPTIVPLEGKEDKVAVHVVSPEGVFWDTLEKLQAAGANSILVLPIEKMMG